MFILTSRALILDSGVLAHLFSSAVSFHYPISNKIPITVDHAALTATLKFNAGDASVHERTVSVTKVFGQLRKSRGQVTKRDDESGTSDEI